MAVKDGEERAASIGGNRCIDIIRPYPLHEVLLLWVSVMIRA